MSYRCISWQWEPPIPFGSVKFDPVSLIITLAAVDYRRSLLWSWSVSLRISSWKKHMSTSVKLYNRAEFVELLRRMKEESNAYCIWYRGELPSSMVSLHRKSKPVFVMQEEWAAMPSIEEYQHPYHPIVSRFDCKGYATGYQRHYYFNSRDGWCGKGDVFSMPMIIFRNIPSAVLSSSTSLSYVCWWGDGRCLALT